MKERNISKSVSQWTQRLNTLGFDKISFPILIVDSPNIDFVYSLTDFASDPDIYHWAFEKNYQLIDCNGNLWTWTYDNVNKTNLPNSFLQTLTLDEISEVLLRYFSGSIPEPTIKNIIAETSTVSDLFEKIADKF